MLTLINYLLKQIYPVEDWLATDALFAEFDRNTISALANQLKPQHVRSEIHHEIILKRVIIISYYSSVHYASNLLLY